MALIFSHEEGLENGWETFFSLSPRSCGLVLLTDGVKTDGWEESTEQMGKPELSKSPL